MKPYSATRILFLVFWIGFVFMVEVRSQEVIFGPVKFRQTDDAPRMRIKKFSANNPINPFVLTVRKAGTRNHEITRAILKINGIALEGFEKIRDQEVSTIVTLKKRNKISVQLEGSRGDVIVVTISTPPKFTVYTNPDEALLLRTQMPEGEIVEYFGAKSQDGEATKVKSISVKSRSGEAHTYIFDDASRLSEVQSPSGIRLRFAWKSDTFADLTAVSADGLQQVTAPVDFSKLSVGRSSAGAEICDSCLGPSGQGFVNQNQAREERNHAGGVTPMDFSSVLARSVRYTSASDGPVLEACIKIAKALAPICQKLNMGLNLPGAKTVVCAALAGVAAGTGYGLFLVPFVLSGGCEKALLAVQLACYGIQIIDLYDGCTQIKRFFTTVGSFIAGRLVVSRSLQHSPGQGPFNVGQPLSASFSVTNRGHMNLVMNKILIGGRLGGVCPNNICPDFSPVASNITLAPGQTLNYSGTFKPTQPGTYNFTVAYQKPDGTWVNPVDSENGTANRASITVVNATPRAVVATSLKLAPNAGPYMVGQPLSGTFSVANRGNANLVMSHLLIGGLVDSMCPNKICPDFTPRSNLTLAPGQVYNYSGTFTPQRIGTYTFSVALQKPDGKWELPVTPENGAINKLSITVQGPGPTLRAMSPSFVSARTSPQIVYFSGSGLEKTVFMRMQLPNGTYSEYWVLPWEIFSRNSNQLGAKFKFPLRGRYTIWARSKDNVWSNSITVTAN